MTLRKRLVLLVLLSILPALAFLLYNYMEARSARLEQLNAEALRVAKFAAGELDRTIESIRSQLTAMALLPSLTHDRETCNSYVTRVAEQSQSILTLTITDRAGTILCTSHPNGSDRPQNLTVSDRAYFHEAMKSKTFVISAAVVSRSTNKLILPLALPLTNAQGEFNGIIAVGMDLQWLSEYFAAKPLPPKGTIVIADRDGTIIVRLPSWLGIVGTKLSPGVSWMLDAPKAGTGHSVGRDGIERIAAYVPIAEPPIGLFVAVGFAKQAAMGDINKAAWQGVATLTLLLVIAILAALTGGRLFIEQPISSLVAVARKWRDGELTARANISDQHSELSRLGTVFNSMAGTIGDREEALRSALRHQELLIGELNHRVKNTLAIVQALAQQSMLSAPTKEEAVKAFIARLVALAAAHDLLTEQNWEGADLKNVVVKVVAPHCGTDGSLLNAKGPPVRLTAKQTVSLTMALHELCTNAVKYGALSKEGGHISLHWSVESDVGERCLLLRWKESGSSPVKPPERRGFGLRLVEDVLAQDLGGEVKINFALDGLECTIMAPLKPSDTEKPKKAPVISGLHISQNL